MKLLVFVRFLGVDIDSLDASVVQFKEPTHDIVLFALDFFGMHLAALASDVFAEEEADGVNRTFLDARGATPAIFGVLDKRFFIFVYLD